MVLLNLFSRIKYLPLSISGKSLFLLLCFSSQLHSEIIPFFNPTATYNKNEATINVQGFIADDPVSIRDFLDDWEGSYTPANGDNFAIEELRVDVGTVLYDDYYVGYFYNWNYLVVSNRDFTDFYYSVKNDIKFATEQNYNLRVNIDGIEEHGIMISRNIPILDTEEHLILFGASAYVSYATDTQEGSLLGTSSIKTDQTYDANGYADYYYTKNLLYKLNVEDTYGIGYGIHFGLFYVNKQYDFDIQLTANNIGARTHFKNLPYSHVDIETKNQEINDKGHTEYNPTISGVEKYKDYIYKIPSKYHVDIKKHFSYEIDLNVGVDIIDNLNIPYISVSKIYNNTQKIELIYENKFHSKGIKYQDENFMLSVISDSFSNVSALGVSGSFTYHF